MNHNFNTLNNLIVEKSDLTNFAHKELETLKKRISTAFDEID
jgi:hypothetical protein